MSDYWRLKLQTDMLTGLVTGTKGSDSWVRRSILHKFYFPSQIYNLLYSGVISKCVVG
jgi:hypothetical protein